MKNILLIGATSLIGKSLCKNNAYTFTTPGRDQLDLMDVESIENFEYAGYDCLILVAGAGMRHGKTFTFEQVSKEYINTTIGVNCTGTTSLLQNYISKNKNGYIVVIGSDVVNQMQSSNIIYTASKVYLDRLIDLLQSQYPTINFIKINPGKVSSRNEMVEEYISPDTIANSVWYCIENNIKKIDIHEK